MRKARWALFFLLTPLFSSLSIAGQMGFSGTVEYRRLAPAFGDTASLSFSPGARFEEENWAVGGYLPLLLQNENKMARVGSMTVPSGSPMMEGQTSDHMGGGSGMSGARLAVGDLNIAASYRLITEHSIWPAIWLNLQTKIPTATNGFGTGKFDLGGGLGFKKILFDSILLISDFGYLAIGDPGYRNPFAFGFGGGPLSLADGALALLLYYQGSTPILEGLAGQSQLSLGANLKVADSLILSTTFSKGFSNSTPQITLSAGFTYYH
ncbi:MAG: hypothetical protein HY537_16520 [Deltaproteobacteria bacterium]|nr:hypothetical protein [Deltaproteobacteria bacterium]